MHRIDGPGATEDNRFTEGSPTLGIPPTMVTADWANAVQEEIAAVIAAAGLSLNKANNGQLKDAIEGLIAAVGVDPATTTEQGIVELATNAEAVAGVDAERAVTPSGLKAAIDAAPRGFTGYQIFNASGSFVVPAGVTRVFVEVWGGGGGGGTGGATNCAGGGGGGGYAAKIVTGLTPGSTVSVTVGNGGARAGSVGGTGGSGGTSSFGAHCSATGGAGGVGGNGGNTVAGGAAGAGVGGDLNVSGQPGGAGVDTSTDYFGAGGGSYKYPGGALRVSQSVAMAGFDATNPGCGGGGGSSTTGGAGANGQVIVWY